MAYQRNTVIDYMLQKGGTRPQVTTTGTGSRIPHVPSRTSTSFSSDTAATSSPDSHTTSSPQDNRVPETQAADDDDVLHMTLDDLLLSPGRASLQRLVPRSFVEDPEAAWFKLTHKVSRQIREIIISDFKDAGYNWTNTPDEVTKRWFKAFAQRYNWDPIHTGIIYVEFKKNASTRLRNLVSDWKRRGKKPGFMGKKIWKRLNKHWETEDHKVKSKKTSKARKNEGGLGPPVHCMGQKSFLRRQYELRDQNGEFPSQVSLLEDTHKRKSDGVIIDLKTIRILNEVNDKVEEQLSQMTQSEDMSELTQPQLSKSELDEIYKTVVPMKRGRRYGMGSIPESGSTSFSSFMPSPILTTLQTELQSTQKELGEAKSTMEKQAKLIESMSERFKNYEKFEAFVRDKMNIS